MVLCKYAINWCPRGIPNAFASRGWRDSAPRNAGASLSCSNTSRVPTRSFTGTRSLWSGAPPFRRQGRVSNRLEGGDHRRDPSGGPDRGCLFGRPRAA
jgi:hypothetical protein